jgi:hypothetical protein
MQDLGKRTAIGLMGLALILVLGPLSAAYAVPLTNTNTTELQGIVVTVTIGSVAMGVNGCASAGGCTTLSVQLTATNPLLINTPLGIDQFFYNAADGIAAKIINVSEAGWKTNFDGGEADGFGKFNSLKNLNSGGTGGISSEIVFTLDGIEEFGPNANNAMFAVHIRFSDGCSGWVSDGNVPGSTGSNTSCAVIPEPATMVLVGSALVGLGFWGRRRLKGKVARQ